jgi:predicted metal-dependent hydrolase
MIGALMEFVRHPRARRYVVRVKADGTVRVTVPRWGSRQHAEAFAQAQHAWIARQQAALRVTRPNRLAYTDEALAGLRERATGELPPRLQTLAEHYGLRFSRVSVRDQRSRWGSCSPSGHISLNWRLVLMPEEVRDYVLIHELMHLRRLDHSPHFWRLVRHACPGFEDARSWLRENRHLLDNHI